MNRHYADRSGRHFVSTRSTGHPCRRCDAPIYTAWAEGLRATVDAQECADEVKALIAGRRTYTRTHSGELIYRSASRIKGGFLRGTIHAQHQCNTDKQGELF